MLSDKKVKIDFSEKHFLIIDDFSEFRYTVKKMVQSFSVKNIDDAGDGETAIKRIEMNSYDVILCDYNLGPDKKDGQQVLEEIKHRGLIKYSTIFILVTAENTLDMVMGALEYKPDDYLTKPFNKDILRSRLEKLIEKKKDIGKIEKALQRNEFERASQMIDEKIATKPKNVFDLLRMKGDILLKKGDYDKAKEVFEKVLSMHSLPWAMIGMGQVYFYQEKYMDARDAFEEIIDENKMIMEAYDWLAKCLKKLGDIEGAQKALMDAVDLSPKSILRQKALGQLAYENKDLNVAEKSLKASVDLGKTSVFKAPDDYASLAKVLMDKESPDEALDILKDSRSEFENNVEASMQAAVIEGIAYNALGMKDAAKKSVEEAKKLYNTIPDKLSVDTAMDMAKACFAVGDMEQGEELVQKVVKNHHDEEEVIKKAQAVYDGAELKKEGEEAIKKARKEIITVNNKGVQLVKEGKMAEAIDFFDKAAKGLPNNKIINANAAQSLIMYMQKNGKSDHYLYQCKRYLDRLQKIDATYRKFKELHKVYEQITMEQSS